MSKSLTQKEVFMDCKKEGKFIISEDTDLEKIKSTLIIAQADIDSSDLIRKQLSGSQHSRDSPQWSSVFKLYYDALHELVEAFLRFDRIKIDNHRCLFAYLCNEHPELEFDWSFFEKIRTTRNGINYYGTPIDFEGWKEVELQIKLYTQKLIEEINRKLAG